jgi:AcrR family transcriptional regulator
MPRKSQFTTEDVIRAALELIREKGLSGLSAPAVADKMKASTMPIYSYFKNMQALEDEVVKKIWIMVTEYQLKQYTGDVWIDQAVGWVRFARDEKNLFKCMSDSRNVKLQYKMHIKHWECLTEMLRDYKGFKDLEEHQIERLRYSHAMLTHGVATSPSIGMNKVIIEDDAMLSGYLSSASHALLEGYKKIPPHEEEKTRMIYEKIKEVSREDLGEESQDYRDFINRLLKKRRQT